MAYSFDATRGETADAIKRRREWVQALLNGVGTGAVPTTVGGGIAEIGDALAGLVAKKRSEKMDREGTAAAMKAAGGNSYIRDLLLGNAGGDAPVSGGGGSDTAVGSAGTDRINLSGNKQAFIDALLPAAIEQGQRIGVDPRIIVAQAAQETGWGRSAPGNNYFGIKSHGKGGGQNLTTHEVVNGKRVKINDSFRTFNSPGDSVAGYADFIASNPRYRPMMQAQGLDAQLAELGRSGYATDPNYANSVGAIARSISLPTMGSNALPGGEGNDMLMDGWGQPDPNRPGHGINTQTGAPSSFSQPDPARYGRTLQGPPLYRPFNPSERRDNGDGTYSTEVSTTWQTPDGQWQNVPSLWMGPQGPKQFDPNDEQGILGAARNYEQINGPTFRRFPTLDAAEAAARSRSEAGGAAAGMQPDPSRFGGQFPKGDRLPDPNAMPQFNPMMARGPLGPQMAPQMAQGMPQQAMNSPAAVPPPNAMNPDPMRTAAVPQQMMRPRGIVSPRAEDNGYVSGPGAAMQQPGGQGGGLLGRLLSRQPMPQAAQAVSGTGGQATAPGGGGNDELMQMYALIDNPLLPESYRAAIIEALKQKQEQADPAYQADLAYKQAQTRALENPEPQFLPGKDGSIFRADKKSGNVEQVYGGKPDKYHQLSAEEIKARGLDPAFAYQVGADDKVYRIGGEGTTVNIDQKSESAFDTELAKKQAGTFDTMASEGLNARADLGIIDELGTLLKGQGGTFTGVSGALAKYGIGGDGIDDIQAAQALINKLVPTQRSPGSGSMSDRDVELFTRSLPSLWNTPGGNEKILGVMRGLAQYKQQQGEIADMVIMGEMTRQEARQALRALPNPLAEFGKPQKAADGPAMGAVVDGFRFKGGDPADQNNWEPVR